MDLFHSKIFLLKAFIASFFVSDDDERGDVPGWVLITLMTAALVVLIWGVASDRLIEIFNRALDSVSGI
ncbi:hypothetical protein [Schaalia vaccimaxillae]|uniref:hypothetical protein n=1 Tax=Schaalia vaccimaxillae TaxID=183916 RepID=UPI0003B5AC8C|nr:hypothetical protein [Schaalia vaccimaxillae]